jgi:hypothetical protein
LVCLGTLSEGNPFAHRGPGNRWCNIGLAPGPQPAPHLAFIGADWLASEELVVIGYFRKVWPDLTVVIHGSPQATAGFQAAPPTLVCRSAGALRRILADSPDTLLTESRAGRRTEAPLDDGWRPQPGAAPPDVQPTGGPAPPRETIRAQDEELLAAEFAPRIIGQDLDLSAGQHHPPTGEILTREELEALLEDDEQ